MVWQVVYYAAAAIIGALVAKQAMKPPKTKSPSLEDFSVPTAEEGREYPALYGTAWFHDPNVTWYGDLLVRTQTVDGIKTRRFYMGLHLEFAQGPCDYLVEIRADDKLVWDTLTAGNTQIELVKPELFGGREKGGGIAGLLDIMMGASDQTVNDYLASVITGALPGMRGVTGVVFRQGLVGANQPSVLPWAFKWSRIYEGWYGDTCWYPERAGIGATDGGSGTLVANEWAAVRIVKNGLDIHLFVDGVLNDTITLEEELYGGTLTDESPWPGTPDGSSPYDASFTLGRFRVQSGEWPYSGWIDEFIFFKGVALTTTDYVVAVAPIDNTHPNWADVTMCLHFDGADGSTTFTDETGLRTWTTIAPAQVDDAQSVFGGESARFLWGNGAIHTPFTDDIKMDGDWTIDLRIRPTRFNAIQYIFGAYTINGWFPGYNLRIAGVERLEFNIGNHHFPHVGDPRKGTYFVGSLYQQPTDGTPPEDMNPAHMIYDARTNPFRGMGYPTAQIDETSFIAAADTLYGENFGLSFKWARRREIGEFIALVEDHIDAVSSVDPVTGEFKLKLLRDDYEIDSLPVYDESNIVAIEDYSSVGYGELISRITVRYTDRVTGKNKTTPPVDNPATARAQGAVIEDVVDYFGIRNDDLAIKVALRDLKKRSNPLKSFTVICNREAWDIERGSVISVSWDKLGLDGVICRVVEVDYGALKDRVMAMRVIEDVYGLPSSAYVVNQESSWTDPHPGSGDSDTASVADGDFEVFEMPYWEIQRRFGAVLTADDVGYVTALVARPNNVSEGYTLRASADGGEPSVGVHGDWAFMGTLQDDLSAEDSGAPINLDNQTIEWDEVEGYGFFLIGTGREAEIIVQSGNRGYMDTIPHEWPAGTPVWRYWNSSGFGGERFFNALHLTLYTDDQEIEGFVITDGTDIEDAPSMTITMDQRQFRPYPPTVYPDNGRFSAISFPKYLSQDVHGQSGLNFEGRNRLLEAEDMPNWIYHHYRFQGFDPEDGTTYTVRYYQPTDVLLFEESGLETSGDATLFLYPGSGYTRLEIFTVRDGLDSWQHYDWTFIVNLRGIEAMTLTGPETIHEAWTRATESLSDYRISE